MPLGVWARNYSESGSSPNTPIGLRVEGILPGESRGQRPNHSQNENWL